MNVDLYYKNLPLGWIKNKLCTFESWNFVFRLFYECLPDCSDQAWQIQCRNETNLVLKSCFLRIWANPFCSKGRDFCCLRLLQLGNLAEISLFFATYMRFHLAIWAVSSSYFEHSKKLGNIVRIMMRLIEMWIVRFFYFSIEKNKLSYFF